MTFLNALLFESRVAFYVFAALAMGTAYAVWLRTEPARRRWIFPAAIGGCIGLFALQTLVTTERERLALTIDETVAAVQARDLAGVMAKVANNFESDGMDRAAFEQYVRSAFQRTEISDTRISGVDVEIDGDEGRTTFTAAATVRLETGVQRLGSQWEVSWVRGADGWKMVRVRPQSVAGMQVNGLRSLRAW
jgi:hypothetical protein